MADDALVLSNLLCFLTSKYGKCTIKVLKSAVFDFYSDKDITAAKTRLLYDLRSMDLAEKVPHLPTRRDGDSRLTREVDDIISVFTFLDERKSLDKLPKYVADGPDNMPTTRLYEGDLKVFMDQLIRMDGKMAALSSTLDIVVHDVRTLQSKSTSTTTSCTSAVNQSTPVRCVNNKTTNTQRVAGSTTEMTGGISSYGSLINNVNSGANVEQPWASGTDWASIATLPTYNPYEILDADQLQSDDDVVRGGEQPLVPYESRQTRRKRQRQQSRQQQQQQQTAAAEQQTPAIRKDARPRVRGPLVIGKSSGSTTNSAITAANHWYRKSVFYVDNVDGSVTAKDLEEFVKSLSVRTVSCNEVKPRRRRNATDPSSSKAFRLCINRDDRDHLLNADKWPAYVGISDWIFKPSNADGESNKRQKTNNQPNDPSSAENMTVTADVLLSAGVPPDIASTADTAMDTTILAGTSEYNAPTCSSSD